MCHIKLVKIVTRSANTLEWVCYMFDDDDFANTYRLLVYIIRIAIKTVMSSWRHELAFERNTARKRFHQPLVYEEKDVSEKYF